MTDIEEKKIALIIHKDQIIPLLKELEKLLGAKGIEGEIFMVGGAVMSLVYNNRQTTKDIDAIFAPKQEIFEAIEIIAQKHNLPIDWLNDGVKGFIVPEGKFEEYLRLPNLKIMVGSAEYLFAMKCLSCRTRADDRDIRDIKKLVEVLNISSVEDAVLIITKFYPEHLFQAKTRFVLDDIITERHAVKK